jgi:phenylalanyl-tRNA synthetase beta chain
VVDVTNYVLMDLGQPLHAFDFDKIKGNIIVKTEIINDNFITIDGKSRSITSDMLMICDEEKPIAIAGVMGGKNSEITSDTTSVILEAATFNASSIRKTSKKLTLQTDASYRFERGTDIDILNYAIDMAAAMIAELTGGSVLKGYVEVYNNPIAPQEITFRFDNARKIIGADITNSEMANIFIALGFSISTKNVTKIKEIIVTVPNRRVDIFGEIDLIEEIARVYNYNSIAPAFASAIDFQRDEIPTTHKPLPIRNTIRTFLAHNGWTEILTPNMTDMASALLTSDKLIKIENPLGEEMSIMRTSMIPSILKILSFNIRQGNPNLKLFETGKIFLNQNDIFNSFIDGIDEREQLVVAITGNSTPRQWGVPDKKFDFFDLKGAIVELLEHLRIPKYKINPIPTSSNIFSENSAEIFVNKTKIGIIGGIKKNVLDKYEIEFPVFIATIDLTAISSIEIPSSKYKPVSPFPVVKRDLAFLVDDAVASKEIKKTITEKGTHLLKSVNVFDVYKGKNIEQSKKSIGFELTFSSIDRTLVDDEIDSAISSIVSAIEKNFAAKLRTE